MARLADIVSFRRDLLFNGAVQIDWLESNPQLAEKAALHFAFHGPSYHGVVTESAQDRVLPPIDTASFALDVVERITGGKADEPFALAIAGYGTGKSHLAVTLTSLLGAPSSEVAQSILANLSSADRQVGKRVRKILQGLDQPFLVVALNGMKDFDLTGEIVRQVLLGLKSRGLDTSPLEDLRPRFRYAIRFTESLFEPLRQEYEGAFGTVDADDVVARLSRLDEDAFQRVSAIYERNTGAPIRAVGQESLHDFVRVARETYCGKNRPFAGILILLDEFGRYLEFSVQRPQLAGPGALQQLFESVQANAEGVFLLGFIQYELKAYIARMAPELRDDLQRYVTRYDTVQKSRLSTNLETLIANLLEKRDPAALTQYLAAQPEPPGTLQADMKRWFPELANHALWADLDTFKRVVQEGCWPLHPLSTWLLYRLASVGRSLQQRSALSLLADAYAAFMDDEVPLGFSIAPVGLCTDALIDEFSASERFGQQGASAQAYTSVLNKYGHLLSADEIRALKAALLITKTSATIASKEDCLRVVALFSGCDPDAAAVAVHSLESERGALSWNEGLRQYEIVSDAVPRAQFLAYLEGRVSDIPAPLRAQVFSGNYAKWFPELGTFPTDFGAECQITTKEWRYNASFANVHLLPNQLEHAFRNWIDARAVDDPKGQLIYCYVGGESNLSAVREAARARLQACLEGAGLSWAVGAPIAISFLHDEDGALGAKVAEYWTLQERIDAKEAQRYAGFILDRKNSVEQDLRNLFERLQRAPHMVFATDQQIQVSTVVATLTRLFEAVYPHHIPFPFDGFSTATGNAAADCSLFTRELFLGHLDRDWITARPPRQRNRAVAVLNESWGALDNAGALRALPAHAPLRRTIEFLDSQLTAHGDPHPLNLGSALRALCGPPYGCSTASAGLVVALFIGARKEELELVRGGQFVGVENWLQAALPRNYLELSVLDDTTAVRVSGVAKDEWKLLLNAWEVEKTHSGKVEYGRKAAELEERLPIPQSLYYQYGNLRLLADQAQHQLNTYDSELDEALGKVHTGVEMGDIGQLSWGAAALSGIRTTLSARREEWTEEQIRVVEDHEARARIETQKRFAKWLPRQSAENVAQLSSFLHRMGLIAKNLSALDLLDEKAALEQHAANIEEHIRFLDTVQHLQSDIASFARANKPNASTSMRTIATLLDQVTDYAATLAEAKARKADVPRDGLEAAATQLAMLKRACDEQTARLRDQASAVYNAQIKSVGDIRDLQAEVTNLRHLFDGQEQDVSDFGLIRRQLDCLEDSYRKLDGSDLNDSEFDALLEECMAATEADFGSDGTPLDNEAAYRAIAQTIRARRQRDADNWMRASVPQKDMVSKANAPRALELKARLQSAPRFLTAEQMHVVSEAIEACDRRLDELEVNGLVARYQVLPEASKHTFLRRIGVLPDA